MKKGDKVYVQWPTGRGGPYEVTKVYDLDSPSIASVTLRLEGKPDIPVSWCEPAEPEIEEDRLYYYDKNLDCALHGKYLSHDKIIKPVHRRWYELTDNEQKSIIFGNATITEDLFKYIYKLITGEVHP